MPSNKTISLRMRTGSTFNLNSKIGEMAVPQFNLATLVLFFIAASIWTFLFVAVPQSSGWGNGPSRYAVAPLVLIGLTATLRWTIGKRNYALPTSMLLAGVIAVTSLLVAKWVA